MENNESKLKKEINLLIARVEQLTQENEKKVEMIRILEGEIEQLMRQPDGPAVTAGLDNVQQNSLNHFLMDFCRVAASIMEDEAYIPYSYATKYSEQFYKIEQGIFETYISQWSEMDLKTFLRFCADLQLVKAEANRKCVYSSGSIHVYYVSRLFMDTAAPQKELQEA